MAKKKRIAMKRGQTVEELEAQEASQKGSTERLWKKISKYMDIDPGSKVDAKYLVSTN